MRYKEYYRETNSESSNTNIATESQTIKQVACNVFSRFKQYKLFRCFRF